MKIESLSLLFDARFTSTHPQDLKNILQTWNIYDFGIQKISEGATRSNWLIWTSDEKRYILRNAGSDLDWLTWQISVIDQLRRSQFPYLIPFPLPGKSGNRYLLYNQDYWVIYPWISGDLLGFQPNMMQVFNVGEMVGNYHRAIYDLEYENMASYELKLFKQQRLQEKLQYISKVSAKSRLKDPTIELFVQHIPLFEKAYGNIPSCDFHLINNLPKLPVHYDLHGKNILKSGDRIVGLIDFDALGVGPRIIDFQNALVYMAGGSHGINLPRVKSFVEGYTSIWPLLPEELEVTYSLMIERLLTLTAQIINNKCTEIHLFKLIAKHVLGLRDEYTRGLLFSLIWLVNNRSLFVDHFYEIA